MFGSNSTEDIDSVDELRRQLRQRYIDIVVVAAVDSADAMDQVNAVMTSLLRSSREINLRAQVLICMLLFQKLVYKLAYLYIDVFECTVLFISLASNSMESWTILMQTS